MAVGPLEGGGGDSLALDVPPRLLLVAWMVAGVQTQYRHLRSCLPGGVPVSAVEANPYLHGGLIERLPLPASVRGTLRSTLTLLEILRGPRPSAVWTQVALPMLPFALTRSRLRGIPIAYAIDCTPALLWAFGGHYADVTDPASPKGQLTSACLRLFFRHCSALLPWSTWAAQSMVLHYGADPARVHVIHPGVDLARWRPAAHQGEGRTMRDDRVQLLFVGNDFERKGGPLLLELFRAHLRDDCDLNVVSRVAMEAEPGVYVHRGLAPTDPGLLELYQRSHVLVVPTLADCFSMAALEAMACGLPVVTSPVGGIPEIVVDGETGALVPPGDGAALLRTLRRLIGDRKLRRAWGAAGRLRAEARFDAGAQAAKTVRVLASLVDRNVPTP